MSILVIQVAVAAQTIVVVVRAMIIVHQVMTAIVLVILALVVQVINRRSNMQETLLELIESQLRLAIVDKDPELIEVLSQAYQRVAVSQN